MNYLDPIVDALAAENAWRYQPRSEPASEPTALAGLALAAHGRHDAAARACAWLAAAQNNDGSVGVRAADPTPGWPTPLAVLAWSMFESLKNTDAPDYTVCRRRATDWLLKVFGEMSPPQSDIGHDTSIAGWPWVEKTHAWVEPTAHGLLALRAAGLADHPRAREAARLLEDRLLVAGGCNYGNTLVLGQQLLPHIQPTGVALVALAGEATVTPRVQAALAYLQRELGPNITASSLAWGLTGLAAHDRWPTGAEGWLAAAARRSMRRGAQHELALVAMAGLKQESPLITVARPLAQA